MTALYILGTILLLIFSIIISSVSIFIKIDDDIKIKIGFWFFRFNLTKYFHKKSCTDKKETKRTEKAKSKKTNNYISKLIKQKGFVSAIKELLEQSKIIISKLGDLATRIRVKRFNLKLTVASDDSAKTALEYGSVCALVFPAVNGFQMLCKVNARKTSVTVDTDFYGQSPSILLDAKLKLRLYSVFKTAFGLLLKIIKLKFNNVRSDSLSTNKNQAFKSVNK